MTPEFLSILLWIPFILVFLALAIPFSAKGFRKGIWRALVSIGATIVAAVISFFLAKSLAPACVAKVMPLLPDLGLGENVAISALLPSLIESLVTGLMSLVLFSLLLLVLTFVCKLLLALIPLPDGDGLILRTLGMAVRLVDAAVLTVLVLLPLYGTLAAYGPSVSSLADFIPEETSVQAYIQTATEHPIVKLSGSGLCSGIYNGLSSANTDHGVINMPEVMQTMSQTTEVFDAFSDGEFTATDFEAFANLPKEVVSQDWFYSAFASASEAIQPALEDLGEEAPTYLTALGELTELPREEFTQCCEGLLDWISFASDKGLFQVMEDKTLNTAWIAESEIIQKTLDVQASMPEDFPFFTVVTQFFRDYMEETGEN